MALVAVIWSVALLSVVAASFLSAGGISYRLAHNRVETARTEARAEAAVNRAVLALLDPRADKRWRADGTAQDFEFDGAHMRVRIQDELGRIDLNHADGSLLAGLLRSAGLDPEAGIAPSEFKTREAEPWPSAETQSTTGEESASEPLDTPEV